MKGYTFLALLFAATALNIRAPVDEQLAQIDSTDYGK
jgi:chromosome segregation ATPase